MAVQSERIASGSSFCRLFGFGLHVEHSVAAQTVDALLLLANLSFSAYGWVYVTTFVQQLIPEAWDSTVVMSVAKVCTYLLTPPVTLVAWQLKKRALTRLVRRIDEIARPSVPPLTPFCRRSAAAWIVSAAATEFSMFIMFHYETGFRHLSPVACAMVVVYNVWSVVPLLWYALLVDAVRRSVRQINDRITTVAAWKRCRGRWKELGRAAVRLARDDFGAIIIAFVVCEIAAIVFFSFNLYVVAYKIYGLSPYPTAVYTVNILFNVSRLVKVVRVSQNCRTEILKTKKILNSINVRTDSDYKELKYAFLFMLHEDISFIPCDIFELSYSNLIKIATLISAYVTFQIQMKLR